MGWFDERFTDAPGRTRVCCETCEKPMWLPASKLHLYKTCSRACATKRREKSVASRTRACETCGCSFVPRKNQLSAGNGRFCSQVCNTAARSALLRPEVQAIAHKRWRESLASGQWSPLKGEMKPNWKGGREAFRKERLKKVAQYKRENPDKVREHAMNRRLRGASKVNSGVVSLMLKAQGGHCNYCNATLDGAYHVDHKTPVSRGGGNETSNLQVLCPGCNLSKGSKTHLEFIEKKGGLCGPKIQHQ